MVCPVASADPLVVVTVLDRPSRPSSRTTADYVRTDDERSSLLPIESTTFITELSAVASNYDYKELSKQRLKKPRQRQNTRRISNNCLRASISFDVVAPNLSVCSKEYVERKANARHRAARLLPPSDARRNHILHEDLNSSIRVGRQFLNPPKVSNFSYSLNKDLFIPEKTEQTLGLTSSYGNNGTDHKCDQLQCQALQQQPVGHVGRDAGEGPNSGQQQSLSGRFQMPAVSKKFNARSGMPSLSNSMPSIKVTPKPVAPCYVDPIVNCPHSFHHRITELMTLESDTIAWEKSRRLRKKMREHS